MYFWVRDVLIFVTAILSIPLKRRDEKEGEYGSDKDENVPNPEVHLLQQPVVEENLSDVGGERKNVADAHVQGCGIGTDISCDPGKCSTAYFKFNSQRY